MSDKSSQGEGMDPDDILGPGEPGPRRGSDHNYQARNTESDESTFPNFSQFSGFTSGNASGFGGLPFSAGAFVSPSMTRKAGFSVGLIGALATILGIVLMVWPHAGISTLAIVVGIFILSLGVMALVGGWRIRQIPVVGTTVMFFGVLLSLFALITLIAPATMAAAIVIALGVFVFLQGISGFAVGRRFSGSEYGTHVLIVSIVSIVIGLLFIIAPLSSLYTLTVVLGLAMAVFGTAILSLAWKLTAKKKSRR